MVWGVGCCVWCGVNEVNERSVAVLVGGATSGCCAAWGARWFERGMRVLVALLFQARPSAGAAPFAPRPERTPAPPPLPRSLLASMFKPSAGPSLGAPAFHDDAHALVAFDVLLSQACRRVGAAGVLRGWG